MALAKKTKKKVLLIDKEAFMEWFWDYDMAKTFFNDYNVYAKLLEHGVFMLKLDDLILNCGYIPASIVADGQEPILNEDDEVVQDEYDDIKFAK
jgi:hypothetical protein